MKLDDFIKLLEKKKSEGYTDIISIFTYSIYESDRATDAKISEEILGDEVTDVDEEIKHLIGQKVLVI